MAPDVAMNELLAKKSKIAKARGLKQSIAKRLSSLRQSDPGTQTSRVREDYPSPLSSHPPETPIKAKNYRQSASAGLGIDCELPGLPVELRRASSSPMTASPPISSTPSPVAFKVSPGTLSQRSQTSFPETHPAFGILGLPTEDSIASLSTGQASSHVTPVSGGNHKISRYTDFPIVSVPAVNASRFAGANLLATQGTERRDTPPKLDPDMAPHILDMLHPCIPFPLAWNAQHDQYIVYLDIQNYPHANMVERVRNKFPSLSEAILTPKMIQQRLTILDSNPNCDYYKRAIELVAEQARPKNISRRRGSFMNAIKEVESCIGTEDESSSAEAKHGAGSSATKANYPKKLDQGERRARPVSAYGIDRKGVVARGKATLIDTRDPTGFRRNSAVVEPSVKHKMDSPLPASIANTSRVTSGTPSPSPIMSRSNRRSSLTPSLFAGNRGAPKIEFGEMSTTSHSVSSESLKHVSEGSNMFGIPHVMITSSGKPVLR